MIKHRLCCHCQVIEQCSQWKLDSGDRTFDELDLLWQWWSRSAQRRATGWHKQAEETEIDHEHRGNIRCLLPHFQKKKPHTHILSALVFEEEIKKRQRLLSLLCMRFSFCHRSSIDKCIIHVFLHHRNHGKAEQQADSRGDGGSGEEHRV